MPLSNDVIQSLAQELHAAEQERSQMRHLSSRYPEMTIEDGYEVSRAWCEIKKKEGQKVIGHKIGLTSRAMQKSSQIDEPDFGTLFDEMLYQPGTTLPRERFILPRVEVELAFILKETLFGPNISVTDVLRATEYVVPALEIIDARVEQFDRDNGAPRKVFDTISDNAANVGIVLGGNPVAPQEVDMRWASALLYVNGVIEETGVAAGILGNPAVGVAWLAQRLHGFGEELEAGEIVLAGSFTRPVAIDSGDVVHADYGPLGAITFSLSKDNPSEKS